MGLTMSRPSVKHPQLPHVTHNLCMQADSKSLGMTQNVNTGVSNQSRHSMNTKSHYIMSLKLGLKIWKDFFVCCSALISLSGMENTTVPNASWMARLKERNQTLKTSLSLRAQMDQMPSHSWPKKTTHCPVLLSHLFIPAATCSFSPFSPQTVLRLASSKQCGADI